MTDNLPAHIIDRQALDVVREQLAPGASNRELEYFAHVANHLDLDPFRGQIVLIGRYDKRVSRTVFRPQITVDGRRSIAVRTGELVGIEGPWWTGPRNEYGDLEWLDVWDRPETPYAARVLVWRRGWTKPSNGTAKWSEMAQDGPLWQRMPAHMLAKVAESLALRRAFPETVGSAIVSVELDADEGESLDVVNPPNGGAIAAQEGSITRPPAPLSAPANDNEWIAPTPEQAAAMRDLLRELGLDSRDARLVKLEILGQAVGHPVADTRLLDRGETQLCIDFLRRELDALANDVAADAEDIGAAGTDTDA